MAAVLLLASCTNDKPQLHQSKYFSTRSFFESEIKRLSACHSGLKKIIVFDGKKDSISLISEDWNKELDLFINSDINKPAWKNSFRIDSLSQDTSLLLTYTALDSSIAIRKMEIALSGNQVKELSIKKASTNFIYKTVQELTYTFDRDFSIVGSQNVLWFYHSSYSVTGILPKK